VLGTCYNRFPVSAAAETTDDLGFWIALTRVTQIGPRRFALLLEALGSARRIWDATQSELLSTGLDRRSTASLIAARHRLDPSSEVALLERAGVRAVRMIDEDYPERLRAIYDPPPVLYFQGELDSRDHPSIAIVGTRGATAYGRAVAEKLSRGLAEAAITVVSGLALGIDAAAHRGALAAGGRTIAVLGSGLNRIYPSQHAQLAKQIAESGAVASEFPLDTKPDAMNFPRRNRVISGMTSGTLVVEAGAKSGALLTAGYAGDQGRDVYAVPGSIFSPMSQGTHRLIRDGAVPVTCVDDILTELQPSRAPRQLSAKDILPPDETERAILDVLSTEGMHIDEIAQSVSLPMSTVSAALAMMELKGMVQQTGGMNYVRGY
jgi:DNA processing protein